METSEWTVSRWIQPYKEKNNQRRQKFKARAIEMYKSGMSEIEISKDLEVPTSTLNYWLRPYKEKHGKIQTRKFHSQELRDKIIKMVIEEGKTIKETAKKTKNP